MVKKDPRIEEFRLLDIIEELRAKCPWDMQQTNESLRKLTIEETYELAEAIISGNDAGITGRSYASYRILCQDRK